MNYLFVGNEPELKNEAILDKKRTLLDPAHQTLNFNLFHTGEDDINLVKDTLYALPFLSDTRLVVLKNFHRANPEEIKSILSYLEKPAKASCLVIDADSDFKKEDTFYDIARFVKVVRFDKLAESDLNAWISKELSGMGTGMGKGIDRDARSLLKELIGEDLAIFKKELEKLAIFTGKSRNITKRDVEMLIRKSRKESTFDLADAILKKDINNALCIIQGLFLNGRRPPEILGLLAWQFRILHKVKTALKEKVPAASMARQLGVSGAFLKKIMQVCVFFRISSIEKGLESILSKDVSIKRGEAASAELALELLLVELCGN